MKDRYTIEGRHWVPLGRAAKLIGTNAAGLRKLMANGTLDWTQSRAGSKTFVVNEVGVMRLRRERQQWLREGAMKQERKRPMPAPTQMESGTMSPLRARLRNQITIIPPAPDGGAPGGRRSK